MFDDVKNNSSLTKISTWLLQRSLSVQIFWSIIFIPKLSIEKIDVTVILKKKLRYKIFSKCWLDEKFGYVIYK